MIQEVLTLCRSENSWLTEQHDQLTKIQEQCDSIRFSDITIISAKLNVRYLFSFVRIL